MHAPADVVFGLDEVDAAHSALAEHDRALQTGRACADDEHVILGVPRLRKALGVPVTPELFPDRRVLVQMIAGPPTTQREMQMLQPMHSRISSSRPSSIFFGMNGSAIDGRAAPMMSHWPLRMTETIVSALVKRPTFITGFFVCCLTFDVYLLSWFSGCVREGPAFSPTPSPSRTGCPTCRPDGRRAR